MPWDSALRYRGGHLKGVLSREVPLNQRCDVRVLQEPRQCFLHPTRSRCERGIDNKQDLQHATNLPPLIPHSKHKRFDRYHESAPAPAVLMPCCHVAARGVITTPVRAAHAGPSSTFVSGCCQGKLCTGSAVHLRQTVE